MNNLWIIYVWFMYYLWIDYEYIIVNELWILCIDYVLNMNKLWTNQNRNDSYYPMHEPRERSFTYNCIKSINNLKILSYFTIFSNCLYNLESAISGLSPVIPSVILSRIPDKILVSSQIFLSDAPPPCFIWLQKCQEITKLDFFTLPVKMWKLVFFNNSKGFRELHSLLF